MKLCILGAIIGLAALEGCAEGQVVSTSPQSARAVEKAQVASSPEPGPKKFSLNPDQVQKVEAALIPILNNDDKKAKLAYGRYHRFIPESLQFALDLRFKNFDHALQVLPHTEKTAEEKTFWQTIIKLKPKSVSQAVCEELKKSKDLHPEKLAPSRETRAWSAEVEHLLGASSGGSAAKMSILDNEIDQIACTNDSCAVAKGLQSKIFDDAFFDKIRNAQRRDTNFFKANYKNAIKMAHYQRWVSLSHLIKLHRAVLETQFARQSHFLKRIRGIGRDIRIEQLLSRVVGDQIFSENQDLEIANHLQKFVEADPPLSTVTYLDYELATCDLKQPRLPDSQ